eukprot:COSAG04_NODE_1459_length_6621_cov_3.753450_2_plen_280_part_00
MGWLENHGTAHSSLAVGSSGVAGGGEDRPAWMAVDGVRTTDWDAAVDATDQTCWLALDFQSSVTITGFRITGRGDHVHDTKDHELQTGGSPTGPWTTVGTFVAKECGPPDFTAAQCAATNSAPTAGEFTQEFTLPSAASSRYWRWVAKTRWTEFQVYLQEIEFHLAAPWGWFFILFLLLGAAAYFGGFAAQNYRLKGVRGRELLQLPHRRFWEELAALVQDGVTFTRARIDEARGTSGGGYSAVPEGEGEAQAVTKPGPEPEPEPPDGDGSGSSDGVME